MKAPPETRSKKVENGCIMKILRTGARCAEEKIKVLQKLCEIKVEDEYRNS